MAKYISCEALDNFFDREIRLYEPCPDKYDAAVELKSASHVIPAADVRPVVRAEFVRCGDGKGVPYMCAHCSRIVPANLVEIWGVNFCPNCGADMRGGDAE